MCCFLEKEKQQNITSPVIGQFRLGWTERSFALECWTTIPSMPQHWLCWLQLIRPGVREPLQENTFLASVSTLQKQFYKPICFGILVVASLKSQQGTFWCNLRATELRMENSSVLATETRLSPYAWLKAAFSKLVLFRSWAHRVRKMGATVHSKTLGRNLAREGWSKASIRRAHQSDLIHDYFSQETKQKYFEKQTVPCPTPSCFPFQNQGNPSTCSRPNLILHSHFLLPLQIPFFVSMNS